MSSRETGAAAIWAAEHDMPCEWSKVPQADQEMYLRMFDAAVAAHILLAAERGWRMVPEEATEEMTAAHTALDYHNPKSGWHTLEARREYRAMLAVAPMFEWNK